MMLTLCGGKAVHIEDFVKLGKKEDAKALPHDAWECVVEIGDERGKLIDTSKFLQNFVDCWIKTGTIFVKLVSVGDPGTHVCVSTENSVEWFPIGSFYDIHLPKKHISL